MTIYKILYVYILNIYNPMELTMRVIKVSENNKHIIATIVPHIKHTNKSTSTYNKKSSIFTEEMARERYVFPTTYVESRKYVNAKKLLEASVIFGTEFVRNIQYKLEHKLTKIQITDLKKENLWI